MAVTLFRLKPQRKMQNYLPVFPVVLSATNTLISVLLVLFREQLTEWKKWIVVCISIVITAAAIYCTVHAQTVFLEKQQNERLHVIAVRDQLAEFIKTGLSIQEKIEKSDDQKTFDEAKAWAEKVESYLETALGKSYVVRLNDNSGLQYFEAHGASFAAQPYWRDLNWKITRLEEFSQGAIIPINH